MRLSTLSSEVWERSKLTNRWRLLLFVCCQLSLWLCSVFRLHKCAVCFPTIIFNGSSNRFFSRKIVFCNTICQHRVMGIWGEFGYLNDMWLDSGVWLHICTDGSITSPPVYTVSICHPTMNKQWCYYSISCYRVCTSQIHLKSPQYTNLYWLTVCHIPFRFWSHRLSECSYMWQGDHITFSSNLT